MKKTCTKCGETKLVSEFHKAGKRKGRKKSCKLCDKARRAELDEAQNRFTFLTFAEFRRHFYDTMRKDD